jgi:hypothetical protein
MISPQWYQPDWCENTEPDLETTQHCGLTVTVGPTTFDSNFAFLYLFPN